MSYDIISSADYRARQKVSNAAALERRKNDPVRMEAKRENDRIAKRIKRELESDRPFVGVDGEGCGINWIGQQNYVLLVAGDRSVQAGAIRPGYDYSQRLYTDECLEFILSLDRGAIHIGFFFNYDVNQIFRDIQPDSLSGIRLPREFDPEIGRDRPGRLIKPGIYDPRRGKHGFFPVYWANYAIDYVERQYLRVARVDLVTNKRTGVTRRGIVPGTSRTIYEAWGFFQCSFVKAINAWQVGTDAERLLISDNKAQRNTFNVLTPQIVEYCKLECRLLAEMMEKLREACKEADCVPGRWTGAGQIAVALLDRHKYPRRPLVEGEVESRVPKLRRPSRGIEFETVASAAMFGGHFEISGTGRFPVMYEYDINSAYPYQMPKLPCPLHTRWEKIENPKELPTGELYIANVNFSHHKSKIWAGLPFRYKGHIFHPLRGRGTYWGVEIDAAIRNCKTTILRVNELWIGRCECPLECSEHLMAWVGEVYEARVKLGKADKGVVLKNGSNSLAGKMMQHSGRFPFHDIVAAGLITAGTRSQLLDALGQAPDDVWMVATDAVYSTVPLDLYCGDPNGDELARKPLGAWEAHRHEDFTIVQPGFYWSEKNDKPEQKIQTRGAPKPVVTRFREQFVAAWQDWLANPDQPPPGVDIPLNVFHGWRIALAWKKPWIACLWGTETKEISFNWQAKRRIDPGSWELRGEHVRHYPIEGHPMWQCDAYDPIEFFNSLGDEDMLLNDGDDFQPFLPEF
jgi:DNA polymerase type B, organellar and viral